MALDATAAAAAAETIVDGLQTYFASTHPGDTGYAAIMSASRAGMVTYFTVLLTGIFAAIQANAIVTGTAVGATGGGPGVPVVGSLL